MQLPVCLTCETRRWTKQVKNDWFMCTSCGSVWETKGFTEQERKARFCPICDKYVEYDNWHPFTWDVTFHCYGYHPKTKRNFHYDCHDKYAAEVEEKKAELDEELARIEIIAELSCPNCNELGISVFPEGYDDIIYMCSNCDAVISTDWINAKVKEKVNV